MDAGVWLDGMIWLAGEWKPWPENGSDGDFFLTVLGGLGKRQADGAFAALFAALHA
jgi:hypothetical protein